MTQGQRDEKMRNLLYTIKVLAEVAWGHYDTNPPGMSMCARQIRFLAKEVNNTYETQVEVAGGSPQS